jgi:hypothetical protein
MLRNAQGLSQYGTTLRHEQASKSIARHSESD